MSKFIKLTIAAFIAVPLIASFATNVTLAEGKKVKKRIKTPIGQVCSYNPTRCEPIRGIVIVAKPKPKPTKKSFGHFNQSTGYTPISVRARR